MPTKDQITDALLKHKRVDLAAESLGLGLRRMYRFMERYGVTLKGVLSWPSMPKSVSTDAPAPTEEAKPQHAPAPTAAEPVRDVRRLIARGFTGPYRGEVGGPGSGASRSADELLSRYHKLRNS